MIEKISEGRNIEVARRLGYYIYHFDKDYEENCFYQLWQPVGTAVGLYPNNEHKTEAEAWQDAPRWDQDLDLALQLVQQVPGFRLSPIGERFWQFWVNDSIEHSVLTLEDLPGAIVDWWLEHVDVKELEKARKVAVLREKISAMQDELAELESAE